jgi:hypothetical protein
LLGLIKDDPVPMAQIQPRPEDYTPLVVLFRGLRYNQNDLGPDAQTTPSRLGPAGETSAWRHVLTGLFLFKLAHRQDL